jgi:DNA-binding CsgD family transcriptional regulator
MLENHLGQAPSSGSVNSGPGMRQIAVLDSEKRKYVVKATALSGSSASQGEKQYLFVMERVSAGSANLPMIFRKYKLSVREQEIVRLLLTGGSNKEIADRLRLSENTIKGYMKLLMRKLGVNNRAGIVAALLVEKKELGDRFQICPRKSEKGFLLSCPLCNTGTDLKSVSQPCWYTNPLSRAVISSHVKSTGCARNRFIGLSCLLMNAL